MHKVISKLQIKKMPFHTRKALKRRRPSPKTSLLTRTVQLCMYMLEIETLKAMLLFPTVAPRCCSFHSGSQRSVCQVRKNLPMPHSASPPHQTSTSAGASYADSSLPTPPQQSHRSFSEITLSEMDNRWHAECSCRRSYGSRLAQRWISIKAVDFAVRVLLLLTVQISSEHCAQVLLA